jgi:aminoglycoside 6'-N-acetyltransferase I
MTVRAATKADAAAWCALRAALWPEADRDELRAEADAHFAGGGLVAAIFLWESPNRQLLGMIELSLRPYADGCVSSPVPYVEGWYVVPSARGHGIGRALMDAAEDWARAQGHTEMASDVLIANAPSETAHKALGFDEVERVIHLRKVLEAKRGG